LESSRIEALSNGVFAIAITLLVLETKAQHRNQSALADALLRQRPSCFAFFPLGAAILLCDIRSDEISRTTADEPT
jgi:uncharacterized membrane protein